MPPKIVQSTSWDGCGAISHGFYSDCSIAEWVWHLETGAGIALGWIETYSKRRVLHFYKSVGHNVQMNKYKDDIWRQPATVSGDAIPLRSSRANFVSPSLDLVWFGCCMRVCRNYCINIIICVCVNWRAMGISSYQSNKPDQPALLVVQGRTDGEQIYSGCDFLYLNPSSRTRSGLKAV